MSFTIPLKEVYSRFLIKIEDNELFSPSIPEKVRNDFLCGYIRSAISEPFVRRLFTTVWLTEPYFGEDEEGEYKVDGLLEFTMKRPNEDEEEDRDFVLEVISYGMVLHWVEPQVNRVANLKQLVGTGDEKFYSQSNHLSELENLQEKSEIRRNNLIDQRGLLYNDYLDGTSATSTLRKTSATG